MAADSVLTRYYGIGMTVMLRLRKVAVPLELLYSSVKVWAPALNPVTK